MTDVNDTPPNGADALNALFDAARAVRDVGDTRPNDVAALQALLEAARADHAAAVVRYLGIEIDDAIEIAEKIDV